MRTPVRSFRDLDVYRQATLLSSEVFKIIPVIRRKKKDKCLLEEFEILYSLAKMVPKLIAESYGDRFSDKKLAASKLEQTMRVIANIVAKIDFIVATLEGKEMKEALNKLLSRYQKQRVKINNLRRAWMRVYEDRR
ncbi:MAG: hypothetical protein L6275_02500 [Candidatus Portnoybacteria bacterium]|nr:hypothetical protein [Candidatus Portnoybacteria bacterium]